MPKIELGPTFHKDGYPTKDTLETIRGWPDTDFLELMKYAQEAWQYPGRFIQHGNIFSLSTGGSSGNEEIIEALHANTLFWSFAWQSSRRGGHYQFRVYAKNSG